MSIRFGARVISLLLLSGVATSGLAQGQGNLQQQVTALQQQVAALQTALNNEIAARIAADQALQSALNNANQLATALQPFISVTMDPINGLSGPHIIFTGANVHVRSGSGFTDDQTDPFMGGSGSSFTGLGNLVVGYNEAGGWEQRLGSHNLVLGPFNSFTSYGGLVAGFGGFITAPSASVIGGFGNSATGRESAILGGHENIASGQRSVVIGGRWNTASQGFSGIFAGVQNNVSEPNGPNTSQGGTVHGGQSNTASGPLATVTGGANNVASGVLSVVSGGYQNTASGDFSVVSGGQGITATIEFQHAP